MTHSRTNVVWSLAASLFLAFACWGFWERGPFALGLNAAAYFAALMVLFLTVMRREGVRLEKNAWWIVPIAMIAASFAIYDNPFLKMVSAFVALPLLFAAFYNFAFLSTEGHGSRFMSDMLQRRIAIFGPLWKSVRMHGDALTLPNGKHAVARRALLGVVLFLLVALTVFIPLLSAADAEFAARMHGVMVWFQKIISASIVGKLLFAGAFSFVTVAALLEWAKPFSPAPREERPHADSLVVGIVLGGILGLYLLFLGIQAGHLWVGSLPIDFKDTERLVKSGFWQLLTLSAINIAIYFFTYRKTNAAVQKILGAFTAASLLLLASAGHRMALYVIFYGFSYEKFFASYTVLFCGVLYVWLLSRLFVHQRADIVRFVATLFLWMYAALTLFPVERFVLAANVALAQRPDTQIRLWELTMLSPDALGLVKRYQAEGKLEEKNAKYLREVGPTSASDLLAQPDWGPWIRSQEAQIRAKAWYEKNLMNVLDGAPPAPVDAAAETR